MIHLIAKESINDLILDFSLKQNNYKLIGKYLTVDGNTYVAIESTENHTIRKDFKKMQNAIDWLKNKYKLEGKI